MTESRTGLDHSPQINELAKALSAAQGAMKPAAFDSVNPHYKSRYASLSSVAESCRASLAANGIAIVQGSEVIDGRVIVTTMVLHSSGQWVRDSLSVKPLADTPQGVGSAITYARRYALAGMLGIVCDDDDDGEAANTKPKANADKAPRQEKKAEPPKQQQPAPQNHASGEPTPNGSAPELSVGAKIAKEVDSIVAWMKRLRGAKSRADVCRELSTLLARNITGAADLTDADERRELLAWLASIEKVSPDKISESWQHVADANMKLRLDRESAQREHEQTEAKK